MMGGFETKLRDPSFSFPIHMDALNKPGRGDASEQHSATLEAVVWKKFDSWVLPMCTVIYLLSFFDINNIGNARVAGMQTALKISNYQYTVALTLTLIPYIAMELPSNLILKRVGPDRLLPAMVTLWGIIAAMQGLVTDYTGLLLCRFFLGFAQGRLKSVASFQGLALYLSSFYPRERLQIRITAFFASASLTGAFSGLLAAAITKMDGIGGKPGWAWIFILVSFGILSFSVLPRSPETARFLSSEERCYVISKLKSSKAMSDDDRKDVFSWMEVWRAFCSPQVLLLSIVAFLNGTQLVGLAFFEPTIVAGLGYAGRQAQLMSVPPFVLAFLASMISAFISDRYGCRGLTVIFFSFWCIIGFSMFYGAYAVAPAVITWIVNNSAPHIRQASGIAFGFITSCSGGILATWLLGSLSPGPNYTAATITFIIMSIGMVVFSSLNLLYLLRENRAKAETRLSAAKHDEPEHLGDRSAWFVYTL
ncbi:major facilitator superfamily domain-containing protein [Pisolithus sp. B1]|nr:major facilitator superfamily domain-containing protein [Pisolithus sp. B1]